MTIISKAKLQMSLGSEEQDTWLTLITISSTTPGVFIMTTMYTKEKKQSDALSSNAIRGRISWHEAIAQSQKFTSSGISKIWKMNLIKSYSNLYLSFIRWVRKFQMTKSFNGPQRYKEIYRGAYLVSLLLRNFFCILFFTHHRS
ncbi:hypothetical protein CAEBREN_14134 [Caenorhabditis brenneri]|uniref:Uncharacterized protein n=1 Tax=Caenorhabditis brenneri TaxID=135651 RepID=G0N6V6_CAEBE|nr:hypothetical protein CAEBREN_14134 [Caenorhabditis brenneri]